MLRFESAVVAPPGNPGNPGDGRWYVVAGDSVLLDRQGLPPAGKGPGVDGSDDPIFFGCFDGEGCWAVGVDEGQPAPPGRRWVPLRQLGAQVDADEWAVAGRAVQLVQWDRTSRYCGRCGAPTEPQRTERSRRCPACGLRAYPRLSPAVIVLIERDGEALMARGSNFRGGMFSAVAGFVEPGETLEDAVRREVREEVGVELGQVRYFASQPWPFPHSLMVGFLAEWRGGEIRVDGEEIVEASWFRPDALPLVPPPLSIARWLIDDWCRRAR